MLDPDRYDSGDFPRGSVTFLVTGIEGSTVRWELHGDGMGRAVGVHDQILRRSIERCGGRLVTAVGDGVVAVFRSAEGALRSALKAQTELAQRDWSPLPPLRVRMGIHSGWAEPIGDEYEGSVVRRAMCVADSGHGGQVIVSSSAVAVVAPPMGYECVSRGIRRLKDLAEPIELFQVIGSRLENELIPLRTVDESVDAVPVQRAPLFGRERELRAAAAVLVEHRLVTLCGAGGVGKTRLAVQIAAEVASGFVGGVRFVDFGLARPGDDLTAVTCDQLAAGRTRDQGSAGSFENLVRLVGIADVLLVVDNCEHVIDESAALIERLLGSCRGVKVLATSRERMRLPAEHVLHVDPFAPHHGPTVLDDPAVRLFLFCCANMGRQAPKIAQLPLVARICALVDRLPLGIELAAARAAYLPLDELLARLEEHYGVLVGRERSTTDRHRSIDGLLHWSRNTLPDAERALFDRLGVFSGPVDLAAVEAVCDDATLEHDQILEVIASLVDRSLLRHDTQTGQYEVLRLIRTFAREQLAVQGQVPTWDARHTRWCVTLVREAANDASSETTERVLARYGTEVVTALDRAITTGEASIAWELSSVVWRSFEASGRAREGIVLLRRAAHLANGDGSVAWAMMSQGLASLLLTVGEAAEAVDLLRQIIQIAEKLDGNDSKVVTTRARNVLSMALLMAGRDGARAEAAQALAEFEQIEDRRGIGRARSSLGMIAARAGDVDIAEDHYLAALVAFRATHERRDAAAVLSNLGNLAHDRHDVLRAARFFDGAQQLYRDIGDSRGLALVLNNLALIALERRDLDRAHDLGVEAEELFARIGDRPGAASAQLNLANVAAEAGQRTDSLARYAQAIETFRAAGEARGVLVGLKNLSEVGWSWGARTLAWRCQVEKATIEFRLGLTRGLRASLRSLADRAVTLAHGDLADRLLRASQLLIGDEVQEILAEAGLCGPPDDTDMLVAAERPRATNVGQLTSREREILLLVSQGDTNPEIAASLFISQRTVDAHLSHIRTKFGVTDRVKLAVIARQYLATQPD